MKIDFHFRRFIKNSAIFASAIICGFPAKASLAAPAMCVPTTTEDMRFAMKGDSLYAVLMVWPKNLSAVITSLATNSPLIDGRKVADVSLPGYVGKIEWSQNEQGLDVKLPAKPPSDMRSP